MYSMYIANATLSFLLYPCKLIQFAKSIMNVPCVPEGTVVDGGCHGDC